MINKKKNLPFSTGTGTGIDIKNLLNKTLGFYSKRVKKSTVNVPVLNNLFFQLPQTIFWTLELIGYFCSFDL
jgi:hypothetical protein